VICGEQEAAGKREYLPQKTALLPGAAERIIAMSRQETLPLLNGVEQYRADLATFVQPLSSDHLPDLVERARGGDEQARQALIEDCLAYVVLIAKRYVCYLQHNDVLELVAVGNLALVEKFDQALQKAPENVTGYLCGVARWTIRNYSLFHSRLFPVPSHEVSLLERVPRVESLDVLLESGEDTDETQAREQERPAPKGVTNRFLQRALDELTANEREVVERYYGFHEAPTPWVEIGMELSISPHRALGCHTRAIRRLRKVLLSNG
jgi:RNA polymerase sigma factor (sigma-70 family)